MNATHLKIATTVLFSTLLAACGGGGGSSNPTVAVAADVTFPADAAVQNFLTSSHTFNASYTDPANNDLYALNYSYVPGADSAFEGQAAKTASFTLNLKKNGVTQSTSTEVTYFRIGPVKSLGAILGTGEYIVAANQGAFPVNAKVGDVGSLGGSTSYTSSAKTSIYATSVNTWELQADTATTAYLCVNSSVRYTNGAATLTGSECYRINTSGAVLGNKLTLSINGKSVTFLN
ncbi:hypothetical protein [Actimicrobium antarcticum]|uniref:Lipoprotein n=1 Tax=Actimicrobium antarcticum TaxID=1051899 RepID=A0ABP7ST65_9BURK